MAKSLIEHVKDYNDVIERKIARLEARAVVLEGEIEKLEAGYEEALGRADVEGAVAKRCEADKKARILEKVDADIEESEDFSIKSTVLDTHNTMLNDLRKSGGARKAWGEWSMNVSISRTGDNKGASSTVKLPLGRMSTEKRNSLRANLPYNAWELLTADGKTKALEKEKDRRKALIAAGKEVIDLRESLGGNKRRYPQQEDEKTPGRVFTHKEIRALYAGARSFFAETLIYYEYPTKIIYAVTGLSRFMQEQFSEKLEELQG
jgi:hypothetical protein